MSEMLFQENCKVATFKAPESDNYRQVVMDYMMKMADYEWSPKETFSIKLRTDRTDMSLNLVYEKGKKYHGVTYCYTKASFDEFLQLFEDGEFVNNSEYYEVCVGNNCQSCIDMAYQQLIDFPFFGSIQPNPNRGTMLKFPGNLKLPCKWGDSYDSEDLWNANSKDAVLEAYAELDMGDVLYFNSKKRAGHLRLVSKPAEVTRFENGHIDPDNSFIYTVEQTNIWDDQDTARGRKTTWFVNRKRSFTTLYKRFFKPVTLTIFTSGEKSKDAYVYYHGENNASTVMNGITGTVTSTFPLAYARITVRDTNGKLIKSAMKYDLPKCYHIDLSELNEELDIASLEKGAYTLTIRAGIARGGVDFEKFEFTV